MPIIYFGILTVSVNYSSGFIFESGQLKWLNISGSF